MIFYSPYSYTVTRKLRLVMRTTKMLPMTKTTVCETLQNLGAITVLYKIPQSVGDARLSLVRAGPDWKRIRRQYRTPSREDAIA